MKKISEKKLMEFLSESNKIEQVYNDESLKQARIAWDYLAEQSVLSTGVILKVHKILMLRSNLRPNEKGYFRTVNVQVGGRRCPDWSTVRDSIESWIEDVATSIKIPGKDGMHIMLDHIQYENVHPFVDGNGRTGRMFMNWQRLKAKLPLLIIHADYPASEGEQMKYYNWFQKLK